ASLLFIARIRIFPLVTRLAVSHYAYRSREGWRGQRGWSVGVGNRPDPAPLTPAFVSRGSRSERERGGEPGRACPSTAALPRPAAPDAHRPPAGAPTPSRLHGHLPDTLK